MRHKPLVLGMLATMLALAASAPAFSQCIECGMQMQQAWHSNVVTQGIYDSMNRDTQRRDEGAKNSNASVSRRGVAAITEQQIQDAVMAPLWPEYRRRLQADGKDSADKWVMIAAKALGSKLGHLVPQYKQRIRSQGQAAANGWYLDAARQTSRRYIQASR